MRVMAQKEKEVALRVPMSRLLTHGLPILAHRFLTKSSMAEIITQPVSGVGTVLNTDGSFEALPGGFQLSDLRVEMAQLHERFGTVGRHLDRSLEILAGFTVLLLIGQNDAKVV